ncbi:MAG: hypothetical protein ACX930_07485 [Erythrobacter sp.]
MRQSAILPLFGALALAGCGGSEPSGEVTTEDGDSGEYTFDTESGETSMTITDGDGETTLRAGSNVAPNLPDGWTIYPGASIQNVINVDGGENAGSMVTMRVDAKQDQVIEHYRKEAEVAGYIIHMDLTTATNKVIAGDKRDGSNFSVSVVPGADSNPATVQLTLSSE